MAWAQNAVIKNSAFLGLSLYAPSRRKFRALCRCLLVTEWNQNAKDTIDKCKQEVHLDRRSSTLVSCIMAVLLVVAPKAVQDAYDDCRALAEKQTGGSRLASTERPGMDELCSVKTSALELIFARLATEWTQNARVPSTRCY